MIGAARRTACLAISLVIFVLGCGGGEVKESGLSENEARRVVAANLCPSDPERILSDLIVKHVPPDSGISGYWNVYYRASDDIKAPEDISGPDDVLGVFSPQKRSTDGAIVVVPSGDESEAFREQTRASCPE